MTWKRELACLFVMGILGGLVLLYGLIHMGSFITENWGSSVAIERSK